MSKKIKKYIFLIPTLIVLLLNCFCYGQVIAAEDNTFISEMPDNYIDPHTDLQTILDIRDFTDYLNVGFPDSLYDDYLYIAKCSRSAYDNLINGVSDQLTIYFDLFDFSNVEITSYDGFFYCYVYHQGRTFKYTKSKNTFSLSSNSNSYKRHCSFNDDFSDYYYGSSIVEQAIDNSNTVILAIQSNVVEFSSSNLDVQVCFSPDLTDSLDRSFTDSEGNTYLRSDLSMRVNNFSNFPIQYTMVITSALVDVDNVFSYYSNDWVYSRSLDSYDDYYSDVAQKQQKSTFAHYVGSGQVDIVNFNFNQINLVQGGIYTVRVYAGRNDCGYASEFVLSSDDLAFEPYHINYTVVYESTFSVLQYDDVKYDPSNSSNGILPYNYGLSEKYTHSYNAIEKENGEIDYTAKDVYSDNDSWYNQPPVDNSLSSSASSTSSFLNFTKSFKNFFAFINYMFNFLPKDAKTLFTIGFSGITIIALVKVLFKS